MKLSSKFISANAQFCTYTDHVPAPYIRKSFQLAKQPKTAEITICGLGFYELYINGINVTKGKLAPYITNPDDVLFYDNYQIEKYLCAGKNAIGILLGNGMQNAMGGDVWDFDKASWRSAPKVALCLEVNGETVFEADQSFKTYPSPISFDDLRCGEHYDARLEIKDWASVTFDDSNWKSAILTDTPCGEPTLSVAEPIVISREIKPVSIVKSKNGFLYDFGINSAGLCRLKIKGTKGQKVALTYGEIAINGELNNSNISFDGVTQDEYWQKDIYTCKGEGVEEYVPFFTYHGFKYVYVEGITEQQATSDLLTYLIMHSDLKEAGSFSCSNEITNKLQQNVRNSTLSNFYYFPTDCPQREKNGWTGDAAVSAEHILLNLSAENSLKQWLKCVRKAQNEKGALPGIVPTGGWGFAWGNGPAWDCALVYLPHAIYQYRGDLAALKENSESIFNYLKYLSTKVNQSGTVAFGLGDWCQPKRSSEKYSTPLEITDTLISMDICKKASEIFEVLNASGNKLYAESLYQSLRKGFRNRFIDKKTIKPEYLTQTSAAMALFYDAVEKDEEANVFLDLLKCIEENNNCFDTGILGARVLFHTLTRFNHSDLAFKMITQPDFPSYGYHVLKGATSLYEDFHLLKDHPYIRQDGVKLNSLNHHFFGDISGWFIKAIGGINLNPNFFNPDRVTIAPNFIADLSYAKACHQTPFGNIETHWQKTGKEIVLKVKVPKKISCCLSLPESYKVMDKTEIEGVSTYTLAEA